MQAAGKDRGRSSMQEAGSFSLLLPAAPAYCFSYPLRARTESNVNDPFSALNQ